jgi:hypothetical protein
VIHLTVAAGVELCVASTDLSNQATSLALIVEQSFKRKIVRAPRYVSSNVRPDPDRYSERNGFGLPSKCLYLNRLG